MDMTELMASLDPQDRAVALEILARPVPQALPVPLDRWERPGLRGHQERRDRRDQ